MGRRDESLRLDALMSQDLQNQQRQLPIEQRKIEEVISGMLPRVFLSAFKSSRHIEVQYYSDVTVIFVEICSFHWHCSVLPPATVVELLNIIYIEFDLLSDVLFVYKVDTVGEVYMAVVGAPESIVNHADVAAHFG